MVAKRSKNLVKRGSLADQVGQALTNQFKKSQGDKSEGNFIKSSQDYLNVKQNFRPSYGVEFSEGSTFLKGQPYSKKNS